MIGDDVVADAGVDGDGDAVAEGAGEDAGIFPRVRNLVTAGGEVVSAHGGKQFSVSGRGIVFQCSWIGEGHAVFLDKSADAFAEAFAARGPGEHGEVYVVAGFVPRAEGAGGDIGADALGAAAVVRPFPVMDYARAVGGEMGEPATGHEAVEDFMGAVFN